MRHPLAIWRDKNNLTQLQAASLFDTQSAVISQIETGFRGVGKTLGRKIESGTKGDLKCADLIMFEWSDKAA